jgi:hypothetical protein
MIALWLATKFPLAWRFRRLIAYGLAAAALIGGALWYRASLIADGRAAGEAAVRVLWAADTAARDKAAAGAIAKAEADKAAAAANNAKELRDANEKLVSIAGERDGVLGLLQSARGEVRALAARAATGQLGADVVARIAASAAEVDRRLADYDTACRRDAVRFEALQRQIAGQM